MVLRLIPVVAVILLQLFFLNDLSLNGDEAIYTLIRDEAARIFMAGLPSLNPIIDYAGPLDFWLMGSVYLVTGWIGDGFAAAWMVRIVPFALFWMATFHLAREIARQSPRLAGCYLWSAALTPIALVFSRVAFPHSLLLAGFSVLLAETLRALRTGEVRWVRFGAILGLCTEAHTTTFFGALAIGAPLLPLIAARLRTPNTRPETVRGLAAAGAVFSVLAYPVLRNFPPPVEDVHERGGLFIFQIRSLLNVLTGYQPFSFLFGRDIGTAAGNVAVLLAYLALGGIFIANRSRWTAWERWLLLSHTVVTGALLVFCHRGRSLEMWGHERYFLTVVPGWLLLQARAVQITLENPRRRARAAVIAILAALGAFQAARFFVPLAIQARETDPSLRAARWLSERCPASGGCVAFADHFWNYWPIRYYTRGSLSLDVVGHNWKETRVFAASPGQPVAGCWFTKREVGGGPSQVPDLIEPQGPSSSARVAIDSVERPELSQVCLRGLARSAFPVSN